MMRAFSSRLRHGVSSLRSFKLPSDPLSSSILSKYSFHSTATVTAPFSQSLPLQKHEGHHHDDVNREPNAPPKLMVVQPRLRPDRVLKTKLDEALNLANSLEEQRDGFFDTELSDKQMPRHVVVQNPAARLTHADTYFGKGTVDTVKCHLNAIDGEDGVDAVFVNAKLTGVQQRNLERLWGKPVLDRVSLIIEIFNAHAFTKEAKLQAELAALMYRRSRLVRVRDADGRYTFGSSGEAEVVSARGRKSGGHGVSGFIGGAGETELQLQRRRILKSRKQLLSEIEEVRRTRALQRASRKRHGGDEQGGMATVAVVGYTNAGKSTLVSVLSKSDLYSDDRLFATVDPKVRSVKLPSGRTVLVSDTVGFISDLPIQLVEAFHATLEEVVEADLLVHVLDSSASDLEEQRKSVMEVLEQIGVPETKLENMIEVYNKIDIQSKNTTVDDDYSDNSGESVDSLTSDIIEEESIDNQEHANSERWFTADDDIDTWVDEDGSSVGTEGSIEDVKDFTYKTWTMRKIKEPICQSQSSVKTSAITGVGLQELLELIDSKLKIENSDKIIGDDMFTRKWRAPTREEDNSVAC